MKFNTKTGLESHQLFALLQIFNSREGYFGCKTMCVQPALFAFTTHKNVFCTLYRAICC